VCVITVGAFDAELSALLDRVEQGEEVLITRYGKAVARLVPAADRARIDEAIAELKRVRAGSSLGGFSWKEMRDEGRR
jgi:prevent-host-death family protein